MVFCMVVLLIIPRPLRAVTSFCWVYVNLIRAVALARNFCEVALWERTGCDTSCGVRILQYAR